MRQSGYSVRDLGATASEHIRGTSLNPVMIFQSVWWGSCVRMAPALVLVS